MYASKSRISSFVKTLASPSGIGESFEGVRLFTSDFLSSTFSPVSGLVTSTSFASVSSMTRPVTSSPFCFVTVMFWYWSERTFDGSRMDSSRSRRLYFTPAPARSGPTAPPSSFKRWHCTHWPASQASRPFAKLRPRDGAFSASAKSDIFHSCTNLCSCLGLSAASSDELLPRRSPSCICSAGESPSATSFFNFLMKLL